MNVSERHCDFVFHNTAEVLRILVYSLRYVPNENVLKNFK